MAGRPRAALGLVLPLLLLVLARPARAQDDPAVASSEALTKHGVELRRQRRDREALEEFRRAYELSAAPRTLAQIALAEQALGRWVDAERDLRAALRTQGDPWILRNRDALESGLSAIGSRLASLEVSADVPGAELRVNGTLAGVLPLPAPVRVEAGSLVIDVRARGYAPVRRETSADPGGTVRESVQLVPLVAQLSSSPAPPAPWVAPEAPPARDPTRRGLRDAGIVVLGAGALGVAAGAYFGGRTLSTKSERDTSGGCIGQACSPAGVALDAEARSLALRSTVWFTGGLVAAAGGAALLWVSRSHTPHERAHALRLSPEVGPDRAGFSVGGMW
jgi:hypothetical protein